jgi:DNA-binding CsgD family transcriptional regulator
MPAEHGLGFLGRTRERELLERMLTNIRAGDSAVLVIRGAPGIGKTALLRHAARQASGVRVAEVAGVQAEMELPFAGIHRLCAPLFDRLDVLPEPQRNALNVALGVASGDTPDRFLVAVAVLSLLAAVADEHPLLCLVDDAHWLDAASGQALGFVARRLLAESVALVFALREPTATPSFDGLPELRLAGLPDADAHALLARAVPGRLDDHVRDRIVAETRGNPLALLELSRGMSAAERAGGYARPVGSDLPRHVQEQYLRRVDDLPAATRQLILLAAAEPLGDATIVWRAAEQLSIGAGAAAPAAEAGLLEIDDRVRFRHPLVRSAVYRAASSDDRRRVHAALADAADAEVDADRRAWHRALAATGPDDTVAAELERSADRAQARGGVVAAAALLDRATALTADPAHRARRALTAADASFQAGAFDMALRLLATAQSDALDGLQRARAQLLRGNVAFASRYGSDAAPMLLQAATALEPFDLGLARRAYLMAWSAAVAAGRAGGGADVLRDIGRAVQALPPPPDPSHPLDLLLVGLALLTTDGRAAATPVLQRSARAIAELPPDDVLRWGPLAGAAATAIWEADAATTIFERQARIARDAGALGRLPIHLSALATDRAWAGDLASAGRLLAESDSVSAATGSQIQSFAALRLLALRGKEAEASALIGRTIEQAQAAGQGETVGWAHWAAAVLHNGLARYAEASAAATAALASVIGPWVSIWALPELVEAAARTGDRDRARAALARLTETTRPAGTDFALGIEARSRALASDGAAAEDLYREAIDRLGRTRLRPELARAQLVFGEWLRRAGRRAEAREQLRAAENAFVTIGMEAFAGRTRRELGAAGEKARKRPVETHEALTPQEEQIARLARDGLTNAEIGARLFLSPRTVEWHLHKVFAKLGITSRSGLHGALRDADREAAPR